jgi:hypothetical protein
MTAYLFPKWNFGFRDSLSPDVESLYLLDPPVFEMRNVEMALNDD